MSLDYPPLNPQPVTLNSGGSVGVTNLKEIEDSLSNIDDNTSKLSNEVSSTIRIDDGKASSRVTNSVTEEILTNILNELKLIRLHAEFVTREEITEQDTI